jgi:hypothetical protein
MKELTPKVKELDLYKLGKIYPNYQLVVTGSTKFNGSDRDMENVNKLLEINKPYEVEYLDVHRYHTDVKLKDFDVIFNSVNFKQLVEDGNV